MSRLTTSISRFVSSYASCPYALTIARQGLDALMKALSEWNGGVIVISHDERFITHVASELWVCGDGTVSKFHGDVQAYKVREYMLLCLNIADYPFSPESHR